MAPLRVTEHGGKRQEGTFADFIASGRDLGQYALSMYPDDQS